MKRPGFAMADITAIAKNLEPLEEGIWVSRDHRKLSYPAERHDCWFQVEEQSFWFMHRANCLIEALKRFPPGGPLFDVGGGNGYVSWRLKQGGFDAILVEPGIHGARNARARGLTPVLCTTLEDAGFQAHSIPAIGLFDVLEHIEDDVGYLGAIRPLLRPGGRIYLTVPAYPALWSVEDDASGHYRRYTLGELIAKLESAGYEIDYATDLFSFFAALIFLFRTVPSAIGLRRRSRLSRNRREVNIRWQPVNRLLNAYLARELSRIGTRRMRFGSSCLVVARSKE